MSNSSPITRPGIAPQTLQNARIRHVDEREAQTLVGMPASGVAIPYFSSCGNPLMVNGSPFHRIRLDHPKGSTKYLSPKGSGAQIYIPQEPPIFADSLVISEGEFKAIALAESCFFACGIGGITSALKDGELLPDLKKLIDQNEVKKVAFLGDGDTSLIYDFSREAVKLRKALPPDVELVLPRTPFSSPKGIDDIKESMAGAEEEFDAWFIKILRQAPPVSPKISPSSLALQLVELSMQDICASFSENKEKLMKFASKLDAIEQDLLMQSVQKLTGIKPTSFKSDMVKILTENENATKKPQATETPELPPERAVSIPDGIFPIPTGECNYTMCADRIFTAISKLNTWFIRGGIPCEVRDSDDGAVFAPLEKERAVSEIERLAKLRGCRLARRNVVTDEKNGERIVWRTELMPSYAMDSLLQSQSAIDHLPRIRQIVACPIIVEEGDCCVKILSKGYHQQNGGTYVTQGSLDNGLPPIETAIKALLHIHQDFAFCEHSDLSRSIAMALSPAMRAGNLIHDDFPIHVAEAVESQSGKDYLQKLHSRIYNETPSGIAPKAGGVGSLDETLSKQLIAGKPFICFSNFRGKLESAILESAIRGQNRVECRALRTSATVDCSCFNWQLSTNGAEFTRDLSNRSIITRIRKQPSTYLFKTYDEGDLLAHVMKNQEFYLSCVFAVIRRWVNMRKPNTDDRRHDFKRWTQTMDWIIQELFHLPPLLDGHAEQQQRTANPQMQWLRSVAIEVQKSNKLGVEMMAYLLNQKF